MHGTVLEATVTEVNKSWLLSLRNLELRTLTDINTTVQQHSDLTITEEQRREEWSKYHPSHSADIPQLAICGIKRK